jgi:hypothetical protein
MQDVKTKLTKLINLWNEKVPDEQDLWGYLGVSKVNVSASLEEIRILVNQIEPFDSVFEVVWFKRNTSKLLKQIRHFLEDALEDDKKKELFNDFLNALSELRFEAIRTFYLVNKQPIRAEAELAGLKEKAAELSALVDSMASQAAEVVNTRAVVDAAAQASVAAQASTDKATSEVNEKLALAIKAAESIDGVADRAEEQEKAIEVSSKAITEAQTRIKELEIKTSDVSARTEKESKAVGDLASLLTSEISKNEKFQKIIEQTLGDANRSGMAGSFKNRKDELKWTMWAWGGVFAVSMIALGIAGWYTFGKALAAGQSIEPMEFVNHLPLLGPFIWLGWFSAVQYGYVSRVREDYAFKFAASMAFEGYKKEAREVDENLLAELLKATISNVAENPLRIYETKSNHGSPIHAMVDALKPGDPKDRLKRAALVGAVAAKEELLTSKKD